MIHAMLIWSSLSKEARQLNSMTFYSISAVQHHFRRQSKSIYGKWRERPAEREVKSSDEFAAERYIADGRRPCSWRRICRYRMVALKWPREHPDMNDDCGEWCHSGLNLSSTSDVQRQAFTGVSCGQIAALLAQRSAVDGQDLSRRGGAGTWAEWTSFFLLVLGYRITKMHAMAL